MGVTDVFSYLKQSSTGAQIEQLLQSAIPLIFPQEVCLWGTNCSVHVSVSVQQTLNRGLQAVVS